MGNIIWERNTFLWVAGRRSIRSTPPIPLLYCVVRFGWIQLIRHLHFSTGSTVVLLQMVWKIIQLITYLELYSILMERTSQSNKWRHSSFPIPCWIESSRISAYWLGYDKLWKPTVYTFLTKDMRCLCRFAPTKITFLIHIISYEVKIWYIKSVAVP